MRSRARKNPKGAGLALGGKDAKLGPHRMTETTATRPIQLDLDTVILGGGFAGVYCARELCRRLRGKEEARRVGLISDQNYMVFQPMLAEVAGASISPRHVVNPIRLLCRGIRVMKGIVRDIDLEKKEVHVDTGSFSAGATVRFRELVLALGAEIDLSRVPGMPEHAMLMQNVGDAMVLRARIISRIEEANVETRPEVRRRLLTFVVVGGGYSGVETAGEMLDLLRETVRFYLAIPEDEVRVILVHSRSHLLPTLSAGLAKYAERKLRERGLEFRMEDRVRAVTATRVYLQSGEVIETNTVVSTVGTAPSRVIRALCDRYELENERYWVKTDAEMRVPGYDYLWAAGDCAAIPLHGGEEGERCPQTAQFAMRQGLVLADNLLRAREGAAPKPFVFTGLGELASIGHRTAVANVMGVRISGFIAWFLWRTIYLSKLPGLDRKLRVVIDWTLDLFFPRDINLLSPNYTQLYQEVHLEPGDRLFTHGEPAFSLYVVKAGSIQLLDREGHAVRTIGAGEFFGERALVHGGGYLYDAVAPERTRLLSVAGEVILPIFKTSDRLRSVLAKTTTQYSPEAELRALLSKLDQSLLKLPVCEVMRTDLATVRSDQSVEEVLQLIKGRRYRIYPMVSPDGHLVGVVEREDFFNFLKRSEVDADTPIEKVTRSHLPAVVETVRVDEAVEKMLRAGQYKCLVTDSDHRLRGILAVMDLVTAQVPEEKFAEVV